MKIPLHLRPGDHSEAADYTRIQLHQQANALTGGRGFRQPSKSSTRIERMAARHFAE